MSAPQRQLTLLDAVSVMVGIIIGAGIFQTTPAIAAGSGNTWGLIGVWALGGFLSLLGALCYAELILNHPESGGDYVYLQRAFGRVMGFLYAWAQFWIVRPAAVGSVAFVFGVYAQQIWPLRVAYPETVYAALSVLALTALNLVGLQQGKWTQNVLTAAKVLGLLLVFAAAIVASSKGAPLPVIAKTPGSFALAMIFSLYAFGGWSDLAFVSAEVKRPEKNILRSMVLAIVVVTAVYILASLAFVSVLGFQGTAASKAVAADTLARVFSGAGLEKSRAGAIAAAAISGLICISALGSINGQIFTGSRIFYAFGKDHPLFRPLAQWHGKLAAPVWSLVAQRAITLALVFTFGTPAWHNLASRVHGTLFSATAASSPAAEPGDANQPVASPPKPIAYGADGFDRLVVFSTPIVWGFYLLVGAALFVLRWKDPSRAAYRVPAFPWVPLVFCASCGYVLYAGLAYALGNQSYEAFWAIGLLLLGLIVLLVSMRWSAERQTNSA